MINFYKEDGIGKIAFANGDVYTPQGNVSLLLDSTTHQIVVAEDENILHWISIDQELQVNGADITGTDAEKLALIAPIFQSAGELYLTTYKAYTARITQSGVTGTTPNVPTATIRHNTLGDVAYGVLDSAETGHLYTVSIPGNFSQEKTDVSVSVDYTSSYIWGVDWGWFNGQIMLYAWGTADKAGGGLGVDWIISIEIKVYP